MSALLNLSQHLKKEYLPLLKQMKDMGPLAKLVAQESIHLDKLDKTVKNLIKEAKIAVEINPAELEIQLTEYTMATLWYMLDHLENNLTIAGKALPKNDLNLLLKQESDKLIRLTGNENATTKLHELYLEANRNTLSNKPKSK